MTGPSDGDTVRHLDDAALTEAFESTLSPLKLIPEPPQLEQALAWGREAIEQILPMIRRFLEPVVWE